MPVLGLLFLRYAYSRFKMVEAEILKTRPVRNGRQMPVEASDFAAKSALYLPKEAQYDYLVNLPENIVAADIKNAAGQPMNSLGEVVNNAMELVEAQSEQLTGVLPKSYTDFSDELLSELIRIFNNNALDEVGGDVIGRIYEYFLNKFAKVIDIPEWTAEKYVLYKELASKSNDEVRKFFLTINEQNIVEIYKNCYVIYWDDFWMFLCQFKIYETIQKQSFIRVVKEMGINPYKLLSNKAFVTFFDGELTELLKDPDYGARLLIDYYLEKHSKTSEVHLPKSLTPEIKYQIIINYIEGDHANGNLLNLVVNGKGSKEFPIDDKLRFKAKKRFEKIWDDPNIHMISQQYGMGVSFGPDLPEKSVRLEGHDLVAEYNVNWVSMNVLHLLWMALQNSLSSMLKKVTLIENFMKCHLVR